MNFSNRIFFVFVISLSLFSCKNEPKNTLENKVDGESNSLVDAIPKSSESKIEVDPEVKNATINSIMLKSMVTPELKTFSRLLVSVGLGDMLTRQKGPFTLIGPSNAAFSGLGEGKMSELLNAANNENLAILIKSHIIEGNLDMATIGQKINQGDGSFKVVSMAGPSFTFTKKGEDVLITDENGVSAQIVNSDFKGINGVAHTIDNVLGVSN